MAFCTEDAINKIDNIVKHGHFKHKKVKLKTEVSKGLSDDAARELNDNVSKIERKAICKEAGKTAHTPVADAKREISNEVRKDMGLN